MHLLYMMERNLGEILQVRVSREARKGVFKVSAFHKPSNLEDKVVDILLNSESHCTTVPGAYWGPPDPVRATQWDPNHQKFLVGMGITA